MNVACLKCKIMLEPGAGPESGSEWWLQTTDLLGRLTGDPGHEPGEENELTGTLFTRPRVSSLQRLKIKNKIF